MYRRDYILNEANKLAMMLARLLGLKAEAKTIEFEQVFNDTLQDEYDTDVAHLVALDEEAFKATILTSDYSPEKLNALSQLLYMFAEPFEDSADTRSLLHKVLVIYDVLEQKHHYQAFENIARQKH